MMSSKTEVYIFTRENNSNVNFVFQGLGYVRDYEDSKPAHVVWGLVGDLSNLPEKFKGEKRKKFIEGARIESTATRYERNSVARKECIDYYGYSCTVCGINFEKVYGDIGRNNIHVHHEVDPINDLKPVCPNCHVMLHKRKSAYSIDELREITGFSVIKNIW